ATEEGVRGYEHGHGRGHGRGPLRVLANSTRLQAVAHSGLGLTGVNSFTAGPHETADLRVEGPASVLVRRRRDKGRVTTSVAVSDPTMDRDTVTVLLRGRGLRVVSADPGVRVSAAPGVTRVEADTRHAYGRSFTVTLRDRD
ncbi:polysaccharide lyase beta-sandwich domain-containing protein, partial [Streptomyces flavofungini]|uniref:polysaccharide lyase beta-sandwich domain-containing protein n=1 Tax=Streptomyces flavofungini TaxID=68200 RepID=UPI0034DF732F